MSETFDSIRKQIKKRTPAPIYFLHGEESFFTDRLVEMFEEYLPEQERTFNHFNVYPLEKDPEAVMELCRRYPLMSEKIVVIVKEAQSAKGGAGKWVNRLAKYAANPSPTTLLVVVARGAKIACKEFTDALKKCGGVVLESSRIKDNQLSNAFAGIIKDTELNFEPKAVAMLVDNIGNDIARAYNEITKLKLILPPGATVTPECIEKNIGISREYNNYELTKALAQRNAERAIKIIRHFNARPKDHSPVMVVSTIFNFFANTLVAVYTPRNDSALMAALKAKNTYALTDYKIAMNNYSASQLIEILALIRQADGFCKGNGSRMSPEDVMENLVLEILMATGNINRRSNDTKL